MTAQNDVLWLKLYIYFNQKSKTKNSFCQMHIFCTFLYKAVFSFFNEETFSHKFQMKIE